MENRNAILLVGVNYRGETYWLAKLLGFIVDDDLVATPNHYHLRAQGRTLMDVSVSNDDSWQTFAQAHQVCMNLVKQ